MGMSKILQGRLSHRGVQFAYFIGDDGSKHEITFYDRCPDTPVNITFYSKEGGGIGEADRTTLRGWLTIN